MSSLAQHYPSLDGNPQTEKNNKFDLIKLVYDCNKSRKDYRNYLHINNIKARETVLDIISAHNLSDV